MISSYTTGSPEGNYVVLWVINVVIYVAHLSREKVCGSLLLWVIYVVIYVARPCSRIHTKEAEIEVRSCQKSTKRAGACQMQLMALDIFVTFLLGPTLSEV